MDIYSLAVTFFIIANPVGNAPAIIGLIKNFPFDKQKKIMVRETIFALLIALIFQFVGGEFLRLIEIKEYTVSIAGGILLFLVSLEMIFPTHTPIASQSLQNEPFLVPIATPLITGGGLMSSIMLYSSLVDNVLMVTGALLLAWLGVTPVLLSAPYLEKILGKRGILALEQLMGMILCLISSQLIVQGILTFMEAY